MLLSHLANNCDSLWINAQVRLLETVIVFIKHMDNERVEFSRKMVVYFYPGEPCEV